PHDDAPWPTPHRYPLRDRAARRVDDGEVGPRGDVELLAVRRERDAPGPRAHVVDGAGERTRWEIDDADAALAAVADVGANAVGRDADALGLAADADRPRDAAGGHVDDGDLRRLFVGDVELLLVGREIEGLGIASGGERAHERARLEIDDADAVRCVVTCGGR